MAEVQEWPKGKSTEAPGCSEAKSTSMASSLALERILLSPPAQTLSWRLLNQIKRRYAKEQL